MQYKRTYFIQDTALMPYTAPKCVTPLSKFNPNQLEVRRVSSMQVLMLNYKCSSPGLNNQKIGWKIFFSLCSIGRNMVYDTHLNLMHAHYTIDYRAIYVYGIGNECVLLIVQGSPQDKMKA